MSTDIAIKLVRTQTSWFEEHLLYAVLQCSEVFYTKTSSCVCLDIDGRTYYKDFTSNVANHIYKIAEMYYASYTAETTQCVPQVFISTILKSKLKKAEIAEYEYKEGLQIIQTCFQTDVTKFKEIIINGLTEWLSIKRCNSIITQQSQKSGNIQDLQNKLNSEIQKIGTSKSISFIPSGDNSTQEDEDVDDTGMRYAFPPELGALNMSVGGLGKKESILFNIPSGGGKTVLACQLSSYFALAHKLNVILITTEQPPIELIPRIVSCHCSVNFKLIKDGIKFKKLALDDTKKANIKLTLDELGKNLHILDWSDRTKSIKTNLEAEIRLSTNSGFKPDLILFDWLGGGLGSQDYKDPQQKRADLMESAERFNTFCKRYDMGGILFAQSDAAQSENVRYITNKHISAAKQLHESVSVAIGVSALMNPKKAGEKASAKTEDVYSMEQVFNCYKVRKGEAVSFNVKRDFKYQRFAAGDLSKATAISKFE